MLQREETSLIWKSVPPDSTMSSVAAAMMRSRVAALLRVLMSERRRVAWRLTTSPTASFAASRASCTERAIPEAVLSSIRPIMSPSPI